LTGLNPAAGYNDEVGDGSGRSANQKTKRRRQRRRKGL